MAHETGSATNAVDLLDKLRLFCIANAITVNEYRANGAGAGQLLSVDFDGGFFSIVFQDDDGGYGIGYRLSQATAWNSSTAWGAQPDETLVTFQTAPEALGVNSSLPIGTYHFSYFAGGVVMVSFILNSGAWSHFCFGSIEKYGTWTGGAIIMGTRMVNNDPYDTFNWAFGSQAPNGFAEQIGAYIRVDDSIDGVRMRKVSSAGFTPTTLRVQANFYSPSGNNDNIMGNSPSTATQASSAHPIAFAVPIEGSSVKHAPIGVLRDVRHCNMQYLDNEQIFDTNWLAFSQGNKNDPDARPGVANAGYMGLLVKVI